MAAVHPTLQDAPLPDSGALLRLLAELRATQARLRALIDTEPECVKLLDAQGRLLEMNAAGRGTRVVVEMPKAGNAD